VNPAIVLTSESIEILVGSTLRFVARSGGN